MMEFMGNNFPGVFKGYTLRVTESHQATKVDTSGTAKAIVESFQHMGLEYSTVSTQQLHVHSAATLFLTIVFCTVV